MSSASARSRRSSKWTDERDTAELVLSAAGAGAGVFNHYTWSWSKQAALINPTYTASIAMPPDPVKLGHSHHITPSGQWTPHVGLMMSHQPVYSEILYQAQQA